jgi:hypothetical protein
MTIVRENKEKIHHNDLTCINSTLIGVADSDRFPIAVG